MYYELEMLEILADWLLKHPAIGQHETLLQEETKRLEKAMLQQLMNFTNETQVNTYLQINLSKLTQLCDRLYIPEHSENIHAALVLRLLMFIRNTAKQLTSQNLELPLLVRRIQSIEFNNRWSVLKSMFHQQGIDQLLIEITGFAFKNFDGSKERPTWANEDYLIFFLDHLEEFPLSGNDDELSDLLIRLGYNYSRFNAFLYRRIKGGIEGKPYTDQIRKLQSLRKEFRILESVITRSFDARKISIVEDLQKWINEELEEMSVAAPENMPNPMKINTTMRVLELAYWEKLQYDNGVYEESNLDSLSEKIAFNFSSKFQEELSAPSVKSKFYPKERSIIKPIEELLLRMLKDVRLFLE